MNETRTSLLRFMQQVFWDRGRIPPQKMLVNGIKTLLVSASDSGGIISNNIENISMLITISKSGETQSTGEDDISQ